MARDTIFICHATPDDNNFVRWLGARLTGHGYKVWADMFGLKGGMPFWNTIEDALREHACKVIYVASKASVDPKRQGVRNELSVADAVRKALGDPHDVLGVRGFLDEDRELVAAEASRRVGGAEQQLQAIRHLGEQLVAGHVSEAVVDLFEVVEVDEQHPQ